MMKRGIIMRCELGNEKLHQMNELKKMPKKGKDWIEKVENGLPIR